MQQKAPLPRRGGRVVEGAALEMLYRGNSIEGSNPSLSVIKVNEADFQIPKTNRPMGGFFMPCKAGNDRVGCRSAEAAAHVIERGLLLR